MKVHNTYQLFASAHRKAKWVKPAQPVELKYEAPTLLIEGPSRATPAKSAID